MKTLTYLTTLLALSIQVMVNGQTQGNQTHVIRVDIMGAKEPVKMNYSNSNITISITKYNQLLEQANSLKINAKKLKDEALTIEIQSLVKQIEASEMSAKISIQKFEHNRALISNVFTKIPNNAITFIKAQSSNTEAERFMKIAKEMREEANAQFTIQSKIGNMSNAEETEALALDKQTEVLNLFDQSHPQLVQEMLSKVVDKENIIVQKSQVSIQETHEFIAFDITHSTFNLLSDAIEQANDMKITVQQLRLEAASSSINQRKVLLAEAQDLESGFLSKAVEISMMKAKLDYEKFNNNKEVIALLMETIKDNTMLVNKATQLNNEAEHLMKVGKEMREEANAQFTAAAKYGEMSNAQENETLAIGKQIESIQVIEKESSMMIVASR